MYGNHPYGTRTKRDIPRSKRASANRPVLHGDREITSKVTRRRTTPTGAKRPITDKASFYAAVMA